MQRTLSSRRMLVLGGGQRSLSSRSNRPPQKSFHSMQRSYYASRVSTRKPMEVNDERKHSSLHWWHAIFLFSAASLVACLLQILLPPPYGMRMTSEEVAMGGIWPQGCEVGMEWCVCPRETICATDKVSLVLLALARSSVFFDYPLYMMMFLSKAHNINNIFRRTVLREWIDFADMHKIHSIFGVVIGIETMFHSFLHIIRWGVNSDIDLLWNTSTGFTGSIAAGSTLFIVWPMVVPQLKERLRFEVRKGLHYLSWVWALALMWHAPSRIYYLIGIPALIYCVDFFFGFFIRNHLIEDVFFERYGEKGVALHFENPPGYDGKKTSYVYIMCPWISKYQWHAFTMFPEPTKKNHTMLCIGTSGDWTKEMYDKIKAPCLRSVYVLGPFASEFSDKAVSTTNALAIASGIGITPTLSLMHTYAGKKRINIIWMCRDPGLIEYFLHKVDIAEITKTSFALIYYTGQRDLVLPKNLPINFFIFRSRPKLEETISGIVKVIHSGEGLPEEMYENQRALADIPFSQRIKIALSRVVTIYPKEEMFEYAVEETEKAEEHADVETGISDSETERTADTSECSSVDEVVLLPVHEEIPPEREENVVSIDGLEAMISSFLGGVGEYSRGDIEDLFKQVDTDESGYIDENEFTVFLELATGEAKDDRESLKRATVAMERALAKSLSRRPTMDSTEQTDLPKKEEMIGNAGTVRYMEGLINDKEKPLEDWSMFYCGASAPIHKILKSIERKYNMDLGVEKFDW